MSTGVEHLTAGIKGCHVSLVNDEKFLLVTKQAPPCDIAPKGSPVNDPPTDIKLSISIFQGPYILCQS